VSADSTRLSKGWMESPVGSRRPSTVFTLQLHSPFDFLVGARRFRLRDRGQAHSLASALALELCSRSDCYRSFTAFARRLLNAQFTYVGRTGSAPVGRHSLSNYVRSLPVFALSLYSLFYCIRSFTVFTL
jgi:hypothetical protein